MMTSVHQDFGQLYPYSDHKIGDHISYRLEGHTEHGEIVWVSCASTLPNGRDFPPHYVVFPDRGGFPDMVLFSDVTMDTQEPTLEKCPYCLGLHPKGTSERCPRNPNKP